MRTYIRVTVILPTNPSGVPLPERVVVKILPTILPPMPTLTSSLLIGSRVNPRVTGAAAVDVNSSVVPNAGSLTLKEAPTTLRLILLMFGSVPVNEPYRTCHGSVSLLTVAEPLAHPGQIAASVTWPTSESAVFTSVLE